MSEISVCAVRAAVYYYDAGIKNWKSADEGLSTVALYENKANHTFRIVAISTKTNQAVINTIVHKDFKFLKLSDQFGQFQDSRYLYGMNLASKEELSSFATAVTNTVNELAAAASSSASSTPPDTSSISSSADASDTTEYEEQPSGTEQEPEPEREPIKEKEPVREPIKPQEPPKQEPKKEENFKGSFLNDLNARLKKSSSTNPPNSAAASSSESHHQPPVKVSAKGTTQPSSQPQQPSVSQIKDPKLLALKEEILAQIRSEIQAVKADIIDAIKASRNY